MDHFCTPFFHGKRLLTAQLAAVKGVSSVPRAACSSLGCPLSFVYSVSDLVHTLGTGTVGGASHPGLAEALTSCFLLSLWSPTHAFSWFFPCKNQAGTGHLETPLDHFLPSIPCCQCLCTQVAIGCWASCPQRVWADLGGVDYLSPAF